VGFSRFGGGGAGNSRSAGVTNLHFSEAHVYEFPNVFGSPCSGCAPRPDMALNYASEIDPAWRLSVGAVPVPVGVWGSLFPRVGHVIHGSPSVASALEAVRAMAIAALPLSPPPNPEAHVIVKPAAGVSTCCQLASPRPTPCFPAGTPPALWDHGVVSLQGTYIWILWRYKTCCVEIGQAFCGLTLLGVGGHGQNACPPIPSGTP
jgi:hypothetical protein